MKKLFSLVSVFAMAAVLSFGCKKDEAAKPAEKKVEETKPAEVPAPAPTPAPEAAKPAEPAAAAAAGTGIAECDAYLATVEKFAKCDKLPKEAKDAQLQGVEAMKTGWAALKDPNVPAEAKKAATDACKQSDDAMKAASTAAGCQ